MIEYLKKAATAYYSGEPFISDTEFDYLAKVNDFNQLGSAPIRAGTIPHLNRLYSLDKFYENDKKPSLKDTVTTPKLDGAAISILYENAQLLSVATRGDGFVGEDITENFLAWEGIPFKLNLTDGMPGLVQIIGEIVAHKNIPNARNYAAGALHLKDIDEFVNRNIHFIAYALFIDNNYLQDTYFEDMIWLANMNFNTVFNENLKDRFDTDGVVVRLNNNQEYLKAGFTGKHPKGAYAIKDTADFEVKSTVLRAVQWQIGKSGKVTPVAIFDPIELEDATITKATLHNAGFIEDMYLCIGNSIYVTRAGGIIPKVLGVVSENDPAPTTIENT